MKEVESFLMFTNFYWQFIKNFSHTTKSLNKFKGKKEWKWGNEHQKTFNKLKEKIISQTVLMLLKRNGKFWVETDASEYPIREVLFQK